MTTPFETLSYVLMSMMFLEHRFYNVGVISTRTILLQFPRQYSPTSVHSAYSAAGSSTHRPGKHGGGGVRAHTYACMYTHVQTYAQFLSLLSWFKSGNTLPPHHYHQKREREKYKERGRLTSLV